jgi:hypothetical protein
MPIYGTIDPTDIVVGELADLARARYVNFAASAGDPEACLRAELAPLARYAQPERGRFQAAAVINYLVMMRGRKG